MVLHTIYSIWLTSHTPSTGANLASVQTVQIVKMKNQTSSVEILCFLHLISNLSPYLHCSSLPLSILLSEVCTLITILSHSSPFINTCLYVWVLLPFSEVSNVLSIFLSPQTSFLDRFQLCTLDIIFSSSFPVSS